MWQNISKKNKNINNIFLSNEITRNSFLRNLNDEIPYKIKVNNKFAKIIPQMIVLFIDCKIDTILDYNINSYLIIVSILILQYYTHRINVNINIEIGTGQCYCCCY